MTKFSYRINNDDWNRFSFSYFAQFESINDNLEYCAARINLPGDDENLCFLVYVACEINYKHKHAVIRNIQQVDLKNKIGYDNVNDYNSNRILEFLKKEILVDRYSIYFENVLLEMNIMYELDSKYITHKIIDKIIFNIINDSRAESVDFPIDLKYLLLDEMYKLDNPCQLVSFDKNKKDLEFFINNPLNLDDQSLRQSWFKEDKENSIWKHI